MRLPKADLSSQCDKQFAGCRLIYRTVPIGDAVMDGFEERERLSVLPLIPPNARKVDGCAQFP
jgi:hypothetical protein